MEEGKSDSPAVECLPISVQDDQSTPSLARIESPSDPCEKDEVWGAEDLKDSAQENKKVRFSRKSEEIAGYGFGV